MFLSAISLLTTDYGDIYVFLTKCLALEVRGDSVRDDGTLGSFEVMLSDGVIVQVITDVAMARALNSASRPMLTFVFGKEKFSEVINDIRRKLPELDMHVQQVPFAEIVAFNNVSGVRIQLQSWAALDQKSEERGSTSSNPPQ